MLLQRLCTVAATALAFAGCSGGSVAAPTVQASPAFLSAAVDNHVYPGISMAVIAPDGTLTTHAYGYADLANRTLMTPATPLRMASVSKSLTAAAILLLDQSGAIALDATVATYVPRFVNGTRITVRQLLDHTSGIPGRAHGDPVLNGDSPYPPDVFFAKLNSPLGGALRDARYVVRLR